MTLTPSIIGSTTVRRQRAYTKHDIFKTQLMIRALMLVALMTALSMVHIWTRLQVIHYGYEIHNLDTKRRELLEKNRELALEAATLKSPGRIEPLARGRLGMEYGRPEQLRVLKAHGQEGTVNYHER